MELTKIKELRKYAQEIAKILYAETTLEEVKTIKNNRADNFINYLIQHRSCIVNYVYFQAEGIIIGSGGIESTVKQIGRRIKISDAQWKTEDVAQVLQHRFIFYLFLTGS